MSMVALCKNLWAGITAGSPPFADVTLAARSACHVSGGRRGAALMLYFSGGTALNAYVDALCLTPTPITFVMPISDDGGSTGEIIRALGGPGIGDIHILQLFCRIS